MALVPSDRYPTQTATDADYPQGKARNVTVSGDNTGTPLERDWINDIWGFQQALLDEAGITPSGTPDKVGASDYLDAIRSINTLPEDQEVVRWVGFGIPVTEAPNDGGDGRPGWSHEIGANNMVSANGSGNHTAVACSIGHEIPNGATITQVRVKVNPASAEAVTGDRMSAFLRVVNTGGVATTTTATERDDGTANEQWLTIDDLNIVVDKTAKAYRVIVYSSKNAADQFIGIEVTFTTNKAFVD